MGRKLFKKSAPAAATAPLPLVADANDAPLPDASEAAADLFDPEARACNTCRHGYASLAEPFHCHRVDATIEPQRPRIDCEYWRRVWK